VALQVLTLGEVPRAASRPAVGFRGLIDPAEALEQVRSHGVEPRQLGLPARKPIQRLKRYGVSVHLCHCDDPVVTPG
jgi:hypothetical protein